MNCRPKPTTSVSTGRRGAITLWTILFLPLMLIVMLVVLEIAHLWYARVELENAMEAAALAAVREWAIQGDHTDTEVPRDIGVAYALANTINGVPVAITDNYTNADPDVSNQNTDCTGNLIFGAASLEAPYTFEAGTTPQCEFYQDYGEVTLIFNFETENKHSTFFDPDVFTIEYASGPSGVTISEITIDLQADITNNTTDYGTFDLDTSATLPPPPNDDPPTETTGDGREGYGPELGDYFFSSGPPPTTTPLGTVNFTPNGSSHAQSPRLTLSFPDGDFVPSSTVRFGADTDTVLGSTPSPVDDTADPGSVFHDIGTNFAIYITFDIGGSTSVIATIQRLIPNPGGDPDPIVGDPMQRGNNKTFNTNGLAKQLEIRIDPTGEFAVRAQQTYSVPSLMSTLCGLPIGPFNIYAKSTAMATCGSARPRLIRVETYSCP